MHYLVASWDPSLRLERPARDVGDSPWSMVLCIFPCVPVFPPEVVCYWDLLGLLTFLCFSFSRQFEVGQVSGKIEFKYVEISLGP